jgi:hypothetical protein
MNVIGVGARLVAYRACPYAWYIITIDMRQSRIPNESLRCKSVFFPASLIVNDRRAAGQCETFQLVNAVRVPAYLPAPELKEAAFAQVIGYRCVYFTAKSREHPISRLRIVVRSMTVIR